MKKQTRLLILFAILLITLSSGPSALAKEGGKKEFESGKSRVEIKIKNEVKEEEEKIEVEQDKFEIRGTITTVVGNNFTVAGQTIFLDPTQVSKFKQKGILEVNKKVKAEGIIKNDVKFATEIMVIGEGQGRFKIEIKGSSFPTTLPTASPLPTSSLTVGAFPSASPQATTSANIKVKVKAVGTVEQVSLFLQQILNFLKSLAG